MALDKKKDDGPPGAPAWMMTFSDITTLLLTFFILIMTFSSIEKEKFDKARGSLKGALGVVASTNERAKPMNEARQMAMNDRTRDEGAEIARRVVPEKVAQELYRLQKDGGLIQSTLR